VTPNPKPLVICDVRERDVTAVLVEKPNVRVETAQLSVGDFVLSDSCAVERKTGADFVSSLLDGRLFDELTRLKDAYSRPVLVLERFRAAFAVKRADGTKLHVNPRSIGGALAKITLTLGIPHVRTNGVKDTARWLAASAERLARWGDAPAVARHKPPRQTLHEKRLFFLQGIPGIGAKTAEAVLEKHGTPAAWFDAITAKKKPSAREKTVLEVLGRPGPA